MKFHGHLGQYGFHGQAVLFAQDVFEVREKLQTTYNTGLVDIT